MIGAECIFLPEVDSTNNYVAKLLLEGELRHGTVILADIQTAGRGQRGNVWQSGSGKQFTASYFLQTAFLSVHQAAYLNKAVAVAVAEAVSAFIPNGVRLKWPNDVLVSNKKLGGILIEGNVKATCLEYVIVGIGINLEHEDHLPSSTSFEDQGMMVSAYAFLEVLNGKLQFQFELLQRFAFQEIQESYLLNLWRLNELQSLERADGSLFYGKIIDVDSEGSVVIESEKGEERFGLQEVRFSY